MLIWSCILIYQSNLTVNLFIYGVWTFERISQYLLQIYVIWFLVVQIFNSIFFFNFFFNSIYSNNNNKSTNINKTRPLIATKLVEADLSIVTHKK
jgi:hypothetical protein